MDEQKSLVQGLHENMNLKDMQVYMDKIVKLRGFDDETARDIMLLIVEEVGELAKALRKHSGIKIDLDKEKYYSSISNEIADVFIYLLDLCNVLDIDLFNAFKNKENINATRLFDKSNNQQD
jgi:NTP pyrophosphatase (non-canonical NTP hydrolase)